MAGERIIEAALISYVALLAGDMFLSWQQVSRPSQEGNPINSWLFSQIGGWTWLVAFIAGLILAAILWKYHEQLLAQVIIIIALLMQADCFSGRFWLAVS